MEKVITNQKGQIAIAMALAIFGLVSAATFYTMVLSGSVLTKYDCGKLQQLNLIRSECGRAQAFAESMETIPDNITLPDKIVSLSGSNMNSSFLVQTRIKKTATVNENVLYRNKEYQIMSLVSLKNSLGNYNAPNAFASQVRSYSEKNIRRATLAGYHYLTDTDKSSNNTNVYFWGPDVVHGRVHSNTDIWIKQMGGGGNNGWPTFLGPVYTAGSVRSFSGTIPVAQVFRAGYWEGVLPIEFNLTAETIRTNGIAVGPPVYDPNRIMFVKVNGSMYTSMIGYIVNQGSIGADVWTNYPMHEGEPLFTNHYPQIDTLWTTGASGSILNHSALVQSKLWLSGRFQGAQTWCAVDTLYLTDDCVLAGTPIGMNADGTNNGVYNNNDILGIVSEKSIIVKYGHKDPVTLQREKPNCGSDTDGIWIYAALCALGEGNGDSHKDGVFSFEYQHPHPSTPAVRLYGNTQVFDKIDIHRRKYPQTADFPWPSNIDYPWYNPLWPEGRPTMERGTIHLRGSVAQRRRGFTHRGLADSDYPNPTGAWNIPLDYCGGASGVSVLDPVLGISFNSQNAPGASGSGIGYKKDYRYDYRFDLNSPPDFPELYIRGRKPVYFAQDWVFKKPPRNLNSKN
jgi:hypothetical protein